MGFWSRAAIFTIVFAIVLPLLGDRYPALGIVIKNQHWLPKVSTFSDYKIKLEDVVRNCEDVLIDDNRGLAILSCDPGRDKWNTVMGTFIDPDFPGSLWSFKYSNFDFEEPGYATRFSLDGFNDTQLASFHPLGIGYWPNNGMVYVINHAKQGPTVEIFKLGGEDATLEYQRTLSHPLIYTPNAVAAISDWEIYLTNDHKWRREDDPRKSALETLTAFAGGSVVYVNLKTNTYSKVANIPFANGITVLNSTHLAVASTSQPAVLIYRIDPQTKALVETKKLRPPFMVDNLSTDSNGHLIMAGHPSPRALEKVAKTNRHYDFDGTGQGKPIADRSRAPSWIAEWDGNAEGSIKDLYVGREFGTICMAIRDVNRGLGIAVGLYEKGVILWKE